MKEPQVPVAKEGYPFIAFAAFATLIAAILGYDIVAFVILFLTAFIIFFFRDPERISPEEEDVIVAPADGKVILIEEVFDERFIKEHAYKISIFMNIFNVHVNRVPYPGAVMKVQYTPGTFYSADTERGAIENESCAITLGMESGSQMAVVQVAGLIARRIVCWATKGDKLLRGQRFGLIRFGSRVDIYLPLRAHVEVSVGQKVRAGESILGYLS